MNWDDLRIFLSVSRHASYTGAARALRIDATTAGRRVRALEQALEARLFCRTPSGFELTQEGATLAQHAEKIERQVLASERRLHGPDDVAAGVVRITSGDGFLAQVLAPALGELWVAHPQLVVEMHADLGTVDLLRREADIAVRFARPRESSLVARHLGTVPFGLFASRAYLQARRPPRDDGELGRHVVLGFDRRLDPLPPMAWLVARAEPRLRSNTTSVLLQACLAGSGIALLPAVAARGHTLLQRVLPRASIPGRDVYAVVHADARRQRRVRVVLDWAAATFNRLADRTGRGS